MKKLITIIMILSLVAVLMIPIYAANPNNGGSLLPQPLPTDQNYNITDYYSEYYYSYSSGYRYSVIQPASYYVQMLDQSGTFIGNQKILFRLPIFQVVSAPWYNSEGYSYYSNTYLNGYNIANSGGNVNSTALGSYSLYQKPLVTAINDYYIEMGYEDTYNIAANTATNYIIQLDTYGEQVNGVGMIGGYRIESDLSTLTISVLGRAEFLLTNGQYYSVDEIEFTRSFNGSVIITPSFITNELTDADVESFHFKGTILISRPSQSASYTFTVGTYSRYAKSNSEYINITDGEMSVAQGEEWSEYQSFFNNPQYRIHDDIARAKYASASTPPSGTLDVTINENGSYTYNVYGYAQIAVDVNVTGTVIPPDAEGETITIIDNGNYDVSQYNYAVVNVPTEVTEFPSLFGWVGNVLNGVLNFELMPNFSLGGIVILLVGIVIIAWLLKVFLGG